MRASPMELLQHRFFSYFPPAQARRLARAAQRVTYPAQRIIFDEDDPSDSICLVLSGRVEILKHSSADHFHTLAYASEDDYIGELGVLDGSGRSARALTQTEVHAAVLPRNVFLEVLSQCPWETTMSLFVRVIANLRETNSRFVQEVIRKERITLIGEMANSFLHDFRSPVTSVQLALGAITKHSDDEATRQACDTISRQLRRMSSMVEDVLQYARGKSHLDRRPLLLRELFTNLLSLNADALRNAGVTVRVRAAARLVAVMDHDRMIRVLQNLLSQRHRGAGRRSQRDHHSFGTPRPRRRVNSRCATTGRASPRPSGAVSSSRSRATGRAAAPVSASRSPKASWKPMAGASRLNPRRVWARRSASACRCPHELAA